MWRNEQQSVHGKTRRAQLQRQEKAQRLHEKAFTENILIAWIWPWDSAYMLVLNWPLHTWFLSEPPFIDINRSYMNTKKAGQHYLTVWLTLLSSCQRFDAFINGHSREWPRVTLRHLQKYVYKSPLPKNNISLQKLWLIVPHPVPEGYIKKPYFLSNRCFRWSLSPTCGIQLQLFPISMKILLMGCLK